MLLSLFVAAVNGAGCPSGFIAYKNTCYYFSGNTKMKHDQAAAACQKMGANLATVDSAGANNFVKSKMKSQSWIGLYDRKGEGKFLWHDRSVVKYFNWQAGEPNNVGNEDCAEIYTSGKWNDVQCNSRHNRAFICSKPANCPSGFEAFGGACYYFSGAKKTTQRGAVAACKALGARLATVDSAAANNFVKSRMRSNSYIGLYDKKGEGKFLWQDRTKVNFFNWARGEPNNAGNEDCAEIYKSSGKWNDVKCSDNFKRAYICSADDCPSGFVEFKDACFYFSPDRLKHDAAAKACNGMGASLATLDDAATNTFVKNKMSAKSWIGLYDRKGEGKFLWHDKTKVHYFNWNRGEPNNVGNEDCAEIYKTGKWNDVQCNSPHSRNYVCSKLKPSKYKFIKSGDCWTNGLRYITTREECMSAGASLGMTSHHGTSGNRQKYCGTWGGNKYLHFNTQTFGKIGRYPILRTAGRDVAGASPTWQICKTGDGLGANTMDVLIQQIGNGNRCVDAYQGNKNGGVVHMWGCSKSNRNQKWRLNMDTGMLQRIGQVTCLDEYQHKSGGKVHMWRCSTSNFNQKWEYDPATKMIHSMTGGINVCLDSFQNKNGGKVHMWRCSTSNKNQRFRLIPLGRRRMSSKYE